MQRTAFWTGIRWAEFVTLVGALVAAMVKPDLNVCGITPEAAAFIALLSKGVRLTASELGLPSSSRNVASWLTALLLATGTFVKQGMPHISILLTPVATNSAVLTSADSPDALGTDISHDIDISSDQ